MQVGMIERTEARFDVALALHACGNATDTAMAAAARQRAAYVAVPCCIGKLKFSIGSGSSFHPERLTWTPRYVGASAAVPWLHGDSSEEEGRASSPLFTTYCVSDHRHNRNLLWTWCSATGCICCYMPLML